MQNDINLAMKKPRKMKDGSRKSNFKYNIKMMKRHWQMYLLILPPLLCIIIFNYIPMYGLQIAFKDFSFSKGFTGSQ